MKSLTLDATSLAAAFPAATGSTLVVVPAGTVIALITSGGQSGKYGPYDATTPATDGRQLATGLYLLGSTVELSNPHTGAVSDTTAPGFWKGSVSLAALATATGVSAGIGFPASAVKTAMPFIRWEA